MKVLYFGDCHVYPENEQSRVLPDGSTTLLRECLESLYWVAGQVRENRPDIVVCGGDTAHTQGYVDSLSLQAIHKGFSVIETACKEVGADLHSLIGNHDLYRDTVESSVHSLPFLPGLVDRITVTSSGILLIPYTENYDAVLSAFEKFRGPLVVTHLDYIGARFNPSAVSSHGLDPTGLCNAVIVNGHYHHPHVLGKVIMAGSLMYHSHRDTVGDIPRGVLLVTLPGSGSGEGQVQLMTRVGGKKVPVDLRWIENPETSVYRTTSVVDMKELDSYLGLFQEKDRERTHLRVNALTRFRPSDEVFTGFSSVKFVDASPTETVQRTDIDHSTSPEMILKTWVGRFSDCGGVSLGQFLVWHERLVEMGLGFLSSSLTDKVIRRVDVKIESWSACDFMILENMDIGVPEKKLTVIEGRNLDAAAADSNGSGKSAIFEALYWGLFGITSRGLRGDQVIRRGAKRASVTVLFVVGGSTYKVKREITSKSHSVSVFCDGEDVSPRLLGDSLEVIESHLAVNSSEFAQTVYLGGSPNVRRFTSLSDPEKKSLIESLIGIHIYAAAAKTASSAFSTFETQAERVGVRVDMSEEKILVLRRHVEEREREIAEVERETARQRNEVRLAIRSDKEEIEKYGRALVGIEAEAGRIEVQLKNVKVRVGELIRLASEADRRLRQAERDRGVAEAALERLEWARDGRCPTCGSVASGAALEALDGGSGILQDASEALRVAEKASQAAQMSLSTARTKESSLSSSLSSAGHQARSVEDKLKAVRLCLAGNRKRLKELKEVPRVHVDGLAQSRDAVVEAEEALAALVKDRGFLREKTEMARFWVKALAPTGIRSVVLDKALDLVNDRLSTYSKGLTGGDLEVRLSSTKTTKGAGDQSKIDVQISGEAASFAEASSGQKQRADLCIQFALDDLRVSFRGATNILIVDEFDSGLDVRGLHRLVDTLLGIGRSVFLVSHRSDLKAVLSGQGVGQRVLVTRKNGSSTVVESR